MAQHKQAEDTNKVDSFISSLEGKNGDNMGVVNIAKYKQPEEAVSAEISAFEQVMSQMNIADCRAFDNKYSQLWQEASDENTLLSVMLCEIDFFKAYNDNYGHQGASFMLLVIGLALKKACEEHDCFLARYENEEFAILMKGGNEEKALAVAEALRKSVELSRTEHKYSSVSKVVTLSIGVSSVYPNSMKMLVREANRALHDATADGRNQVSSIFPHKSNVELSDNALENRESVTEEDSIKHNSAEAVKANEEKANAAADTLSNSPSVDFKQKIRDMKIADCGSFHDNFVKLWEESKKENELLSMLMCEVDFFQPYIDNYGVAASEDMLITVATVLQKIAIINGCFVAHVEGEKFIILMKGGNATSALKVAQSLHKGVVKSNLKHDHSEATDIVTMSIGLSSLFPSDLNTMKSLMIEANTALHAAITTGRNQISVH
ncbi:diguanylate cyclase [Psychromonas sp. MME2]|uniref:diguanylate cyclase domain-containing protein n=1 Tax=Psychromonas sp. MME2 TaxID=3231033 RepID=UPI00339C7DD8